MTFTKTAAPTRVGRLSLYIHSLVNAAGAPQTPVGSFDVELQDANGATVSILSGDLVPQLTPAQQTSVMTLITALRTKAATELL